MRPRPGVAADQPLELAGPELDLGAGQDEEHEQGKAQAGQRPARSLLQ